MRRSCRYPSCECVAQFTRNCSAHRRIFSLLNKIKASHRRHFEAMVWRFLPSLSVVSLYFCSHAYEWIYTHWNALTPRMLLYIVCLSYCALCSPHSMFSSLYSPSISCTPWCSLLSFMFKPINALWSSITLRFGNLTPPLSSPLTIWLLKYCRKATFYWVSDCQPNADHLSHVIMCVCGLTYYEYLPGVNPAVLYCYWATTRIGCWVVPRVAPAHLSWMSSDHQVTSLSPGLPALVLFIFPSLQKSTKQHRQESRARAAA